MRLLTIFTFFLFFFFVTDSTIRLSRSRSPDKSDLKLKNIELPANPYYGNRICPPLISKTLQSLDNLLSDDDSDLLSKVESLKNFIREKKMAKEVAEKSKSDSLSNDNNYNDNLKTIENGVLPDDSDRKKISLRLKPTSTLKQAKDLDELERPKDHDEQEHNKSPHDKQSCKH